MLRNLLDRLAVDRAIVVGHSWGGTLATTFALDHPQRVAGLVLLSPPTHPFLRNITWLYAALATPFLGWLFARTLALPFAAAAFRFGVRAPFRPQAPPRKYLKRSAAFLLLRPATFLANARDVAGLEEFLARQVARYGALTAPTIIITGDRDHVVSPRGSRDGAGRLGAGRQTHRTAGHRPHAASCRRRGGDRRRRGACAARLKRASTITPRPAPACRRRRCASCWWRRACPAGRRRRR